MIIPARFNGPAGSANGGYAAGLFAQAWPAARSVTGVTDPPVRVTLRRPPPLDTPLRAVPVTPVRLRIEVDRTGSADDSGLVAEVEQVDTPLGPPVAPVSPRRAVAAGAAYPGFSAHPFPSCYVCGPRHPDGLRIFPGPVGDGRVAAPFLVPASTTVATVWAALDCPGGWAVLAPGRPYVLGRMTATVATPPVPGQRCVVVGELVAASGRKAEVRTALYDPTGGVLGQARATWIAVAAPDAGAPA
ncbi:hypothetical protein ACN27F_11490 [Solwaraspora sp. WMMB335]|uniref:hypothetical protein n=1 Tax=Solwaraspora sp. WMMB335 TaxID=3404118 RepID=UPI003B923A42